MGNQNKKLMKQLVIDEIYNIKKHATKEEIAKLNLNKLSPSHRYYCFYGMMTGDCNSMRAVKLIKYCCSRIYEKRDFKDTVLIRKCSLKSLNRYDFWSPLEVFFYNNEKSEWIENAVDFLKDKKDIFELK